MSSREGGLKEESVGDVGGWGGGGGGRERERERGRDDASQFVVPPP